MGEPDNRKVALMAQAALDAAMDKAEELGLERMEGLYGIQRAMNAIRKTAALTMLLGSEGMNMFGKAIEDRMAMDAVKQAEDILKGEM